MNTFMNGMKEMNNFTHTANGALAHKSTNSAVYDMFAFGGTIRAKSKEDKILLFKNAYEENTALAIKCLFYLSDCRGGQGERDFFRVCFNWLAKNHKEAALRNLKFIPEYRRWDDVIYSCVGTPLEKDALSFIRKQLILDLQCKTPSLLGKWMPSENTSSEKTRIMANIVRKFMKMSHKEYRKTLSLLRQRINIVERLMSANQWDKIEFDKIPSKAGLIYKNAFARRDIIAKKYEAFATSKETKVNASTLYPYEVVQKAHSAHITTDKAMVEKYWENLPDYLNGKPCKMMCVVDTSGSMTWTGSNPKPIDVAISLGMYCAERVGGPFKNHYISFSRSPRLIKVEGVDFCDKVNRIYRANLCENTNLAAVFDMMFEIALRPTTKVEDMPDTLVIISDMQIDCMSYGWREDTTATEMERICQKWKRYGITPPRLVYWNVNATNPVVLDKSPKATFVSGCSPVIFKQVLTGKTGYDLMIDTITAERYAQVG